MYPKGKKHLDSQLADEGSSAYRATRWQTPLPPDGSVLLIPSINTIISRQLPKHASSNQIDDDDDVDGDEGRKCTGIPSNVEQDIRPYPQLALCCNAMLMK